ncbi:sulfite exporter TauE/SafE family protein [candidate division KSB1 bacterium]|nr:sulfite exporter TauE/SafE family protein [candidate division KSB1 bacterium]
MHETTLIVLLGTALSIGFIHTLIGPDHYLPFILLAKARGWRLGRTLAITLWCGLGHVLSSVLIGLVGIAAGIAISKLEGIESVRGGLASWLLIGFGLAYGIWGLRRGLRGKVHTHRHFHDDGISHAHDHAHIKEHSHIHEDKGKITPWALFIIFAFGPCEPLIPLVMVPASQHSWWGVALVALVFGVATIGTMMVIVGLSSYGLLRLQVRPLERYVHALAGGMIALSGMAIMVLGV